MIIRKMTQGDIPWVFKIEEECFSMPWSITSFEKELENEHTYYIVAETDGTIAGYMGMWVVLGEGQITNIAVAHAYRRKGIGKALLAHMIEYAKGQQLQMLFLEVRESNNIARSLYESFGFTPIARRRAYYRKPIEDAIVMMTELTQD